MIEFNCTCSQNFSFPNDAAGTVIECPACRQPMMIPVIEDVTAQFPEQGYPIADTLPPPAASVSELIEAFSRDTLDAHGYEKDLRPTLEDVRNANYAREPDSLETAAARFDPGTGEAIEPLGVVDAAAALAFPMEAFPRFETPAPPPLTPLRMLTELFRSRNFVVLAFVFLFQAIAEIFAVMPYLGFAVPPLIVIVLGLLAHYGCVVEETGPEGRDELPRPVRNVSWIEDLWQPFQRMIAAFILCYFPAWLVYLWDPSSLAVGIAAMLLGAVGTLFFPAVLVTMLTSGTALNLRPDRVWGIMKVSQRYRWALVCWLMVLIGYGGGIIAFHTATVDWLFTRIAAGAFHSALFDPLFTRDTAGWGPVAWCLSALWLFGGVCAMHYFCWNLGLLYRENHARFPWVYQQHTPVNSSPEGIPTEPRRAAFYNRLDARLAHRRYFGPM